MAVNDLNVNEQNPIDSIVANLLEATGRKGRGFVMDLARQDGKVSIEIKESLKPHDDWRPPADYRAHHVETTDSLIAYANRYGTKENSLVFFSESGCSLVIDEQPEKGHREVITLDMPTSEDWREWSDVFDHKAPHRALYEFLLKHEANLTDPSILRSMSSVKATSTVNFESDIRDDGNTLGVMFKSSAGDDLKKFPKVFGISLPVLAADEGGERWATATVRLEILMPTEPKGQPMFALYCSQWKYILKKRIEEEGASILKALPGWTVIHGNYATKPHELSKAG